MDENFKKAVGSRIRTRREALGLTREQLAENAELSFQFLADVETGRSNMTTVTLYKLAQALNLSCDAIVFGTKDTADLSETAMLLASLSKEDKILAEEILKTFVKAVKRR